MFIKNLAVGVLLSFLSYGLNAETKKDTYKAITKEETYKSISEDLAAIQGNIKVGTIHDGHIEMKSMGTDVVEYVNENIPKLIKGLASLKEKYKDNPHIEISGFTINIGFGVSVSLTFKFK
ncbi:hypothetical protein HQQ94_12695 [Shewanella sp. VB17]|uniref:hypothetical protein n=1 Tax=Shewanella sp. VB17 TaxID=2739432 RepID=UPI001563B9D1|nr:hypothetical protein [Shewanella sp. VB17]NRD74078.1 hypothetical protein [Shewanella sp. VB17]